MKRPQTTDPTLGELTMEMCPFLGHHHLTPGWMQSLPNGSLAPPEPGSVGHRSVAHLRPLPSCCLWFLGLCAASHHRGLCLCRFPSSAPSAGPLGLCSRLGRGQAQEGPGLSPAQAASSRTRACAPSVLLWARRFLCCVPTACYLSSPRSRAWRLCVHSCGPKQLARPH